VFENYWVFLQAKIRLTWASRWLYSYAVHIKDEKDEEIGSYQQQVTMQDAKS
jgi:hypothetical protein